jgi:AhpD family alkylhydroperoxidase
MDRFNKRTYTSTRDLIRDLNLIISNWRTRGRLTSGKALEPAFRERLMLAVTGVNQCRYCSYVHSRMALNAGITPDQVHRLDAGSLDGCPEKEIIALLYAQHWAESQGKPDPAARQRLVETYGADEAHKIELTIRIIQIANLLGNTFDYLLYRLKGVPA